MVSSAVFYLPAIYVLFISSLPYVMLPSSILFYPLALKLNTCSAAGLLLHTVW